MIADGNTVGLPAEVAQDLPSAAKGRLGIDDPILPEQSAEKSQKQLWLLQRCVGGRGLEFLLAKRPLEAAHELAPKHPAEDLHRQEESVLRIQTAGTSQGQTAGMEGTVTMGLQ